MKTSRKILIVSIVISLLLNVILGYKAVKCVKDFDNMSLNYVQNIPQSEMMFDSLGNFKDSSNVKR